MTTKERLEAFIAYLELDNRNFEKNTGLSNGFVNHVGEFIRKASIEKIKKKYNELNEDWLKTGYGEMISVSNNVVKEPEKPYQKVKPSQNIYADKSIPVFDGVESISHLVDIPQFRDCNFGKIVYDDSMAPAIQTGATIFCKKVKNKLLIVPGQVYFFKFNNFEIVRRLKKTEDEKIVLAVVDNVEVSPNGFRKYDNFPIRIDQIEELYEIRGLLKLSLN